MPLFIASLLKMFSEFCMNLAVITYFKNFCFFLPSVRFANITFVINVVWVLIVSDQIIEVAVYLNTQFISLYIYLYIFPPPIKLKCFSDT